MGLEVKSAELARVRALYDAELTSSACDADMYFEHACLCALVGDKKACLASLTTSLPAYRQWARTEPDLEAMANDAGFRAALELLA